MRLYRLGDHGLASPHRLESTSSSARWISMEHVQNEFARSNFRNAPPSWSSPHQFRYHHDHDHHSPQFTTPSPLSRATRNQSTSSILPPSPTTLLCSSNTVLNNLLVVYVFPPTALPSNALTRFKTCTLTSGSAVANPAMKSGKMMNRWCSWPVSR